MNKRLLRKIHRWLGLIAGIQLLAWTVSGLYFTVIPIEEIRGGHLLTGEASSLSMRETRLLSPSDLLENYPELALVEISDISLTTVLGEPIYLIDDIRIHAATGERLSPVNEDQARSIANQRTELPIIDVELIEQVSIDSEYRGGELPAWRISLAGSESAALYVGTHTGRVRAVRTDAWRWFDFLWSLHIMDYEAREDFNHLLIQAMAILGLVTVISGLCLFFITLRLRS